MNYDCIGAGQRTVELCELQEGWIDHKKKQDFVIEVYHKVFELHQMLWYLLQAYDMAEEELKEQIAKIVEKTDALADQSAEQLKEMELSVHRQKVNELLKAACHRTKASIHSQPAYYFGHNFKKANLDGKDFSQSLMIGSNLEGCSLKHVNFLGADLRDVNVKNTDLSTCIYLTQMQVNSMRGNKNTKLPEHIEVPSVW